MKTVSERYQRSKIITASYILFAVTLGAFTLGKFFLPQGEEGRAIPSLIESVALLGFGLSASMSMVQYGYQAWVLDLPSFTEWYSYQQIIPNDGLQDWYNSLRGWNIGSQYRLMGPIGFLAGIIVAGFGLVMIVAPLFGS